VVLMVITHWWKISLHAAGSAGAGVVLTIVYAAPAWLVAVFAASVGLVSWSRVRLDDHTPAQVLVGVATGGALIGGLDALLR
jgi:hypothetical protein